MGLSAAAAGAGGVAGALVLGQFAGRRDPLALMAGGGIASGLLTVVMGHVGRGDLAMTPAMFLGLLFATGLVSAALFVPYRTVLQRETPPRLLGRVTTVGEAMSNVAMIAAPPLGAALAATAGVPAPYLAGGYGLALLGLVLLTGRSRIRKSS